MSNVINLFAKDAVPARGNEIAATPDLFSDHSDSDINQIALPMGQPLRRARSAALISFRKMQEAAPIEVARKPDAIDAPKLAERFAQDEAGGFTIWSLMWLIGFISLCGVAVDTTNAMRVNAQLQASADSAALAAVRHLDDPLMAKTEAVKYAEFNMPQVFNGGVLDVNRATDFAIGTWDEDARQFSPGGSEPNAVGVMLRRDGSNGNKLATTFLKVTGFAAWDIARPAVAATFVPGCVESATGNSIIANGEVELSSNNEFRNTCIHGKQGVKMSVNNVFHNTVDPDTGALSNQVSMTNHNTQLQVPAGDLSKNPGLEPILASNRWLSARLAGQVQQNIAAMLGESYNGDPVDTDLQAELTPSYITHGIVNTITRQDIQGGTIDFADPSMRGRIHHIVGPCNKVNITASQVDVSYIDANNQLVTVNDTVIRDQMIISECEINIASGTKLWNVVVASRANIKPHQSAINVGQGVHLGRDDNCQPGDGAALWSAASVHMPSQVELYGTQIVAAENVHISAQVYGIEGISIQAGNDVKITSLAAFGAQCSGGIDATITAEWYRLVQ